jgi:hypothetical protein
LEKAIKGFYQGLQNIRIQPMKFSIISILKAIMVVAVIFNLLLPIQTQAVEYSWLKTKKHENLFVYTDFNECNDIADRLNEVVKRILSHSHIKTTISNSFVFQTTDKDGTSVNELLDDELITDNKIMLHIYGKCIKYNSAYLYQFDIHFGIIDKKISQALLYSSPQYSVMGVDNKIGMDMIFRKLFEDAVTDYLFANKTK